MSASQNKILSAYKKTTLREKLLTLVFIVVILVLWSDSLLGRYADWNGARKAATVDLMTQQQWLDRSGQYEAELQRALSRVDPTKTFEATQLSGRIDSLLRSSGLSTKADIDPVNTREGEIFNDHNIRVRLNRISISQLIEFNQALKKDTPYINIESVRIRANKRNPEELDVRFEINSFDLKDGGL